MLSLHNKMKKNSVQTKFFTCELIWIIIFATLVSCIYGKATVLENPVGTFSFANYYASHMVLHQSPRRANIWGWASLADIGSQVTISLTNSADTSETYSYNAIVQSGSAPNSAVWQVLLDPITASYNAYVIQATLGTQTIEINDILFGDVWFCSGQSNMQMRVDEVYNGTDELNSAEDYPNIRLFYVAFIESTTPQYELLGKNQDWTSPTYNTLRGFSALCWLYGKEIHKTFNYPVGLILSCWGGTRIEAWSSPDALSQCPNANYNMDIQPSSDDNAPQLWKDEAEKYYPSSRVEQRDIAVADPNADSNLWNSMVHPMINLTITGAIWYQGEANTGYRRDQYNCSFRAMIEDWRTKFNTYSFAQTSSAFPFGFIQLATSDESSAGNTQGFTDIRWHQTADIGTVPNNILTSVFMGAGLDTPDYTAPTGAIHPRDKTTLANRLALAGKAVAYGQNNLHYQGPLPTLLTADNELNTLTIEFDGGEGSDNVIEIRGTFGFEVCCSTDGVTGCSMSGTTNWVAVTITSYTAYTVTLSWQSCAGQYLLGLRYAWKESPCPYLACPIYGLSTSLPLTPFIYQGLISNRPVQLNSGILNI